jgi:hypothetical protein
MVAPLVGSPISDAVIFSELSCVHPASCCDGAVCAGTMTDAEMSAIAAAPPVSMP